MKKKARAKTTVNPSDLRLQVLIKITGVFWHAEYVFDPSRKWRFDYACSGHKIAIEIEGGAYTRGRHTRGSGFVSDMEKYNRAAVLGWRVLRYTPDQVGAGDWICDVKELMQ